MKNTLENKERFFSQYWGQSIYNHERYGIKLKVGTSFINYASGSDYIELKPLELITDEEAIEVGNIFGNHRFGEADSKLTNRTKDNLHWLYERSNISDYLRSKGYALPYLGISVQEQIEFGWVKLKEENN